MKVAAGKRYRHYKGKEYTVLALARHSETLDMMVVYQAEYDTEDFGKRPVWVRPLDMFEVKVVIEGVEQQRFTLID